VALAVAACGGGQDAPADSASPTPLTVSPATLRGAWDVRNLPVGSDQVIASFVLTVADDTSGYSVDAATGDTVRVAVTFDGDSATVTSAVYADAPPPVGTGDSVLWRAVVRGGGAGLEGSTRYYFAARPDSAVGSVRLVARRRP
jgi:hypothetical protein